MSSYVNARRHKCHSGVADAVSYQLKGEDTSIKPNPNDLSHKNEIGQEKLSSLTIAGVCSKDADNGLAIPSEHQIVLVWSLLARWDVACSYNQSSIRPIQAFDVIIITHVSNKRGSLRPIRENSLMAVPWHPFRGIPSSGVLELTNCRWDGAVPSFIERKATIDVATSARFGSGLAY